MVKRGIPEQERAVVKDFRITKNESLVKEYRRGDTSLSRPLKSMSILDMPWRL